MKEADKRYIDFRATIEGIFKPRGFTVAMVTFSGSKNNPGESYLELSGKTKDGADGFVHIRFYFSDMRIKYAKGNKIIIEWLADRYFKRPKYNYYDPVPGYY